MKKLDTYLNLCTQVYDLSKPKPPEDDCKFYKSYVNQANGHILEPMKMMRVLCMNAENSTQNEFKNHPVAVMDINL